MFFSLFYYICFDPFITRGFESIDHEGVGIQLSRGGRYPVITRRLVSIYHEGVVIYLSWEGWNPFNTRGLEYIYHEGVGIHLSRGSWNPFITRGLESIYHEGVGMHLSRGVWNLIDRFNPATHPRPCWRRTFKDLEIVGDRCSFCWYGCIWWPSMI